ncbi:hypothetical protein TSUD_218870 [Trifolium subterraneum]|uniref:RNase H type-1 domain-containing protein n=1 Tax=Trifolium subterraneum TaxID=3900 RepID=A0A2Z6MHK9_TRISU|nr:hypothetical protein TSUD_218870 [Trifolium subterraneum]
MAMNQARFHNNHIDRKSVRDFTILKKFNVSTHHSTNTVIKGVLWQPPLINWLKCNIDGAAKGNPGLASCGGIFRNHVADMIYCFVEPLGTASTFQAELCRAMRAIEVAYSRNWKNIWLETDSVLVVFLAFKNLNSNVTWNLRNRRNNVKLLLRQMNCIVSHIFRKGNQVADTLANFGSSLSSLASWHFVSDFVKDSLVKNKLGIPSFRICNS